MRSSATVEHISECFIIPEDEAKQPIHYSPWDLAMLSVNYIQKGLLFPKPSPSQNPHFSISTFLQELRDSLSTTLTHFYPFSGRLVTRKQQNPHSYIVYLDPSNGPGAKFIHAVVDLSISEILSPIDTPLVVQSFFDHDRATNHDGHTMSLLTVQVTELVDGIFIGCSANHTVVDGISYWHFFNMWSEVFKAKGKINHSISRPPIHKRWIPDGNDPFVNLPFTHHDQFVRKHVAPPLRERSFHFSSVSVSMLKAKANSQCKTSEISSLQAVSALVWRCMTRARSAPRKRNTSCSMAINNRPRLEPPLSSNYFGNCLEAVRATAIAGELLENEIGWAAGLLYEAVANHDDKAAREFLESWVKAPRQMGQNFDPYSVMIGSSPRFDMYGNDFGLGKALAVRSGYANKISGKVTMYPGSEGGGSMDLEVCLSPETMAAFECDDEFLDALI